MEDHSRPGNPVYEPVGGDGYAHIPMDCLRAKDINNLYYAGRVIGADPLAYASIRVMGTSFTTGEAAGVAASMPNTDIEQIREQLSNVGSIL